MRRCAAALLGQRARRRWLHLIVGGALFMPFWMVGTVVVGMLLGEGGLFTGSLGLQFGAYAVGLPLVAVAALFPLARPMSVATARALCGLPADTLADGPARGREAKARTAGWLTLHLGAGALISGASLALPRSRCPCWRCRSRRRCGSRSSAGSGVSTAPGGPGPRSLRGS